VKCSLHKLFCTRVHVNDEFKQDEMTNENVSFKKEKHFFLLLPTLVSIKKSEKNSKRSSLDQIWHFLSQILPRVTILASFFEIKLKFC